MGTKRSEVSSRAIPEWVRLRLDISNIWKSIEKGKEFDRLHSKYEKLFEGDLHERYTDMLFDQYQIYKESYDKNPPTESPELIEKMAKAKAMWDVEKAMYFDYNDIVRGEGNSLELCTLKAKNVNRKRDS